MAGKTVTRIEKDMKRGIYMKQEDIMQRFIDGRILIFCDDMKEIKDFLNLCSQYHLRTRSGSDITSLWKDCETLFTNQCATFINRYPYATAGVSYWNRSVSKDEYPIKIEDFVIWKHIEYITSSFDDIDHILER